MEADDVRNKTNFSEQMKQFPLSMLTVEHGSKKRLLFDVSSRKIHGVSSSVFPDATCAFENGGWLLMIQDNSQGQQTVFLVHPNSGRQLHLPPVLCPRDRGVFVFYVNSHGTPLVVARIEIWSFVPTDHIACPGDGYWSVYTHDGVDLGGSSSGVPPEPTCIVDVALSGTQAVCLDLSGEVLMFDVTEMTWRRRRMGRTASPAGPTGIRRDGCFLVAAASGGEVVLVSRSHTAADGVAFKFFKLDMEALEWSLLDDQELDDTSWFLCKGHSFRAKEAGKRKVYTFGRPKHCIGSVEATTASCFSSVFRHEIFKSITNIYAYDLDNGTVDMVIPASVVTELWKRRNRLVFDGSAMNMRDFARKVRVEAELWSHRLKIAERW
ncbi:hypothetical protein U9M48_040761, partial [Paspalum notatum var. saurae]